MPITGLEGLKTKINEKITINRATSDGVLKCTGELFEHDGIQFCLTNSFDGDFYAIEVLSGMSSFKYEKYALDKDYTDSWCKRQLKAWIMLNIHNFTPELIERTKKQLNELGMKYPLNERIV